MLPLMMLLAATPAPPDPPTLAPSSKWVVDYGTQNCSLSRSFKRGENQIGLALVPDPTITTEVILFVPETHDRSPSQDKMVFTGVKSVTAPASSFVLQNRPVRSVRAKVSNEWIVSSNTLNIGYRKSVFSFPMADSGKGLSALKACQDDLFKEWGIDPTTSVDARAFRRDAVVARGDASTSLASSWFKSEDYPYYALGHEGEVKALWRVGLDGKPYDCRIFKSSGTKALDEATCESVLKKGKYDRIVDKQGKPALGWDWERVVWLWRI